MPTVECSRADCLNHGVEVCKANRITWCNGQCSGYITSREAMKVVDAPAVERKHGAITQKQGRTFR